VILLIFYKKKWKETALCLLLMVVIFSWFLPKCFCIDEVDASTAISQAEETVNLAYTRTTEAEAAGADVSLLLDKLDTAGVFLSQAHSAFRSKDFESAFSSALACIDAVDDVADVATRLKIDAEEARSNELLLTGVTLSIFVILFLIFAFFGWRLLKRWYSRVS
jgi:hypothetical protein